MSMGNRNEANRELKEYLHLHGITYKQLADVSGYSPNYLYKIMRSPLPEWNKSIILEAVDRIVRSTAQTTDGDLRTVIETERISCSEIAAHAGVQYGMIWGRIYGETSLTAQWRTIIENAINKIREERRLNYESV